MISKLYTRLNNDRTRISVALAAVAANHSGAATVARVERFARSEAWALHAELFNSSRRPVVAPSKAPGREQAPPATACKVCRQSMPYAGRGRAPEAHKGCSALVHAFDRYQRTLEELRKALPERERKALAKESRGEVLTLIAAELNSFPIIEGRALIAASKAADKLALRAYRKERRARHARREAQRLRRAKRSRRD